MTQQPTCQRFQQAPGRKTKTNKRIQHTRGVSIILGLPLSPLKQLSAMYICTYLSINRWTQAAAVVVAVAALVAAAATAAAIAIRCNHRPAT